MEEVGGGAFGGGGGIESPGRAARARVELAREPSARRKPQACPVAPHLQRAVRCGSASRHTIHRAHVPPCIWWDKRALWFRIVCPPDKP